MWISSIQEDKERLLDILSREEFASISEEKTNPLLAWLQKGIMYVLEWFPDVSLPAQAPQVISYVLFTCLLLGIIAAILYIIYRMVARRKKSRQVDFHPSMGLKLGKEGAYGQEAELAAQQGNYSEAIRILFMNLVHVLDQRQWLRAEKWKTNWEYMDELSFHQPEAANVFKQTADVFEKIWYGGETADEVQYRQLVDYLMPYWQKWGDKHEV